MQHSANVIRCLNSGLLPHRLSTLTRINKRRLYSGRAASFDPSELEAPEVDGSVEFYQRQLNATFDSTGVVTTFEGAVDALAEEAVTLLYDRAHWGRFRIVGEGAIEFMHNKTTANFRDLSPGNGCDTVFCTSKGKIIDLATAYVQKQGVFLVVSPGVQKELLEQLDKFVFRGDKVEFEDVCSATRIFSLHGPQSRQSLVRIGVDEALLDGEYGNHQVFGFEGCPVIVAVGNELDRDEGYTVIVDDNISGEFYKNLIGVGCRPIGYKEWDMLRVLQGRPDLSTELKSANNPFEVNLFHAVSLDKGCFLGQESISRLYTRDAIRRRLWGLEFDDKSGVSKDDLIYFEDKEVGIVTSSPVFHQTKGSELGMGFLKTKLNRETADWTDKDLTVRDKTARAVMLHYMIHDFIDGKGAPKTTSSDEKSEQAKVAEKEEKLKAMQARLDEFMRKQKNQ